MIKKLRIKLVAVIMLIVLVLHALLFTMVIAVFQQALERQIINYMQSIINNPIKMGPGERESTLQLPYFMLDIGTDGAIVASSGDFYDLSDTDYLLEVVKAANANGASTGLLSHYGLRYMKVSRSFGLCYVFTDTMSENMIIHSLVRICLLIACGSLLIFLLISTGLVIWITRPVSDAWKQQRQFVSDASHELKTPLTVIMTNAEILQSGECDPDTSRQLISNISVMSGQMRGLVESLLTLARVDNGNSKMVFSTVDFSAAVSDALLPFEPVYFEKGLTLDSNIEEGILVRGSLQHLQQLIGIFADNAQKYCTPGTVTTVTLKKHGKNCILTVSDYGDPLSAEDLKNIFKRFYRLDKARSMNHSYGLGLSIAQTITQTHHGKIHAESANGINSFIVQLPVVPAKPENKNALSQTSGGTQP